MSEKIIILHPENQPEVDIYPIIKEGSIPNSVIDNQKIKSRTIINSNIALNTLKYEVLHQTLKDLIDSKITQVNMQNYLSSYYYNVEETQQYVGSEINTLHQTIQNEFYSKTTIDDMLMEKTDLSLFRQYLPGTYLDLTKQQDNQTNILNIHADGSIFLANTGNKTNSGNYYLPNSIVKTEDAPNGYFVLSTTNDDYQSLYNLGAYDKITTNADGTYTITRQTGYIVLDGVKNKFDGKFNNTNNEEYYYEGCINYISKPLNTGTIADIISNTLKTVSADELYIQNTYGIAVDTSGKIIIGLTTAITTIDEANVWLAQNPISIQYKLATATTEKVEKNHYARYNERFILEHNKREAERSANLGYFADRQGRWWVSKQDDISEFINQLPNGTYNISADFTPLSIDSGYNVTSCFFWLQISGGQYSSGDGIKTVIDNFTSLNQTRRGYLTFTKQSYTNYEFRLWGFGNHNGGNHGEGKCSNIMLVEGDHSYPYQQYEGKTIHEKDLGNYTNIYNVSKLYQHYYKLEAQPSGDTIYVTCWSTQNTKILLEDITRYAFSNVQVYNYSNDETIQVIKWASSGFRYINDSGNIDSNGYTVTNYYINGEPTTY